VALPALGVERLWNGALDNPNASVLSVRVPLVQLARTVHGARIEPAPLAPVLTVLPRVVHKSVRKSRYGRPAFP